MITRTAVPEDACEILGLLKQMHAEAPVSHAPVHSAKAIIGIVDCIHRGVAYVAENDAGEIVGSIGGLVYQDWWSQDDCLGDRWFYVRPENRNSRAAFALFKMFIGFADANGIPVKVAVVNGEDVDRKDKFYERFGLIKAGSSYQKGKV